MTKLKRLTALLLSTSLVLSGSSMNLVAASPVKEQTDITSQQAAAPTTAAADMDSTENRDTTDMRVKELVKERTANSTTYKLNNGSTEEVFYGGVVRFEDEDGKLKDYDPSLTKLSKEAVSENGKELEGYQFANKEGDKKHYIPSELSEETPILMENNEYEITFHPLTGQSETPALVEKGEEEPEAKPVAPADLTADIQEDGALKTKEETDTRGEEDEPEVTTLAARPAMQADIGAVQVEKEKTTDIYDKEVELPTKAVYDIPDADMAMEYISLPEGLKENIVLQKKPESNIFTYQMKLTGLVPLLEEESGQILFLDKENGELQAYISNPYMNDATEEAYSEEVAYQLLEKEGGEDTYLLNLIASEEYLNAAERQYPVTIDPTVTWVGSSKIADTYIINGGSYTSMNFSGNSIKAICAGKGKQGVFRTFMSFTGLTTSIKGKYVDSAKLTLYETAKSVKGQKIQAHRVTKGWSAASITWKNQATYTGTPISSVTSKGSAAAANTFNLTSFARNIANGSAANYGIMLRGSNESTTKFVQYSSTRDSANAARRPKLSVVYYDGPTSASSVKLKSAYVKKGSNITLSWAGINSKSLNRVEYRVAKYNDSTQKDTEYIAYSGSTKIGTTASGTKTITASAKWPAGCYRIYVRGVDNGGIKATGIGVTLHIDSTAPALSSASLTPVTSTTAYSSNSRPVIKWSGASDAHFNRVEYSINGGAYASAGTAASGGFTLPAGKLTKPGTYVFRVRSADKAANYSGVKTINYYFDNQAPTGKIAITDGVGEHDGQIEIALTASDVGSGIKQNLLQMLDAQGNVVSTLYDGTSGNQTIYLNPDDIAEADYTLKQTVKDKAGNTYAGKPQAIKIIPISAWQPKNVTAQDKINYKTYIKWDRKSEDELPANISYEIYRGTESGFTADESTLAASGIKTNYWCEPNVRYGEKFYYKVRAVRTSADGKVIKESPFSLEVSSRVTAADEYEKRLGEQDYWDYTTVSTPNGNGSIEHSKGNFTYSQQDASLPSAELSFDIVRNYNSQSTVKTAFGLGWDHSLNLELLRLCDPESGEENGYVFKDGSGTIFQFKKQEDGSYAIPGSKEYRLTELLQDEMVSVGGEEAAKENAEDAEEGEETEDELSGPLVAYRFLMKDKENQSYYFNSGGQLVYVTEPNGTWQTFAYDENQGLLTKITNNADRELTFTYQDGEGEDHLLIKAITLPDKSSIQYTYADEHLKKVTRKAADSDASVTYAYEYTKDGKVGTVLDAENNAYTIGYASEKADSVTYPNGDKLTLSYQDGKTVVKKLAAGGGELYTESVEYDKGSGNPVKKTDALGNVTSYIYKDNLLSESSRMVDYQELVNGVVETRKKLLTTKSVYDENGNPLKETGEDGSQTTYKYGATEEVNINNPTEIIETAGDGKLTSDTTYTYDDKGNELSSEDSVSDSSVSTVYQTGSGDEISRTEKETNELKGNVTSTSETTYDEDGNQVSESSKTGDITETSANEYDVMGRQIKSVDSDGTVTKNTYDFLGYLVKIETDYNGIVETSTTSYSPNGQVKEEVAADGTVTSYTYDNMNRLIAKTVSKDGKTDKFFTSYEYGNVTTFTGTDGSTNKVDLASIEKTTNANGDVTAISY